MRFIIVFVLCLLGLCPLASQAQQRAYVKANIGYGLGISTADLWGEDGRRVVYENFGAGFLGGIGGGYYVFDKVGVELSINYHLGERVEYWQGRGLQLTPCVVLSPWRNKFVAPYGRGGLLVAVLTEVVLKDINFTNPQGMPLGNADIIYGGGVDFGGVASIGTDLNLTEHLSIFGEVQFATFAFEATRERISDKNIERQYRTATFNKFKIPYGALGLNLGVKARF
jgi:hypothetical protein